MDINNMIMLTCMYVLFQEFQHLFQYIDTIIKII